MTRLIITTHDSSSGVLGEVYRDAIMVHLGTPFIGGPLPTEEMLEELPGRTSGLGATEMRILELVDPGDIKPNDVFPGHGHANERRVFDYWEFGTVLDGLADCPVPAVSGLIGGPFTMEMHDDRERHRCYKESGLSLTPLGKAILAGTDDFSRHNPIRRWWGGTELTNEHLWRWD
jgi:hypothetical protein